MPLLLFAPGAGAPSSSDWMRAWAARLAAVGRVVSFDYPYQLAGRRLPDPLPRLIEAHRRALDAARRAGEPVVLVGKSMGSRVGCHLAALEPVSGLVCFGYPLQGAGKRRPLRDQALIEAKAPILFMQGTRDPLCPLPVLARVRRRMQARSELYVVEDGDHSLRVARSKLKALGSDQALVDAAILAAVDGFVRRTVSAD